jgi:hypothetical protein
MTTQIKYFAQDERFKISNDLLLFLFYPVTSTMESDSVGAE